MAVKAAATHKYAYITGDNGAVPHTDTESSFTGPAPYNSTSNRQTGHGGTVMAGCGPVSLELFSTSLKEHCSLSNGLVAY